MSDFKSIKLQCHRMILLVIIYFDNNVVYKRKFEFHIYNIQVLIMDKVLVIVLILSLSNETLAWKNWNMKNYLKTTEHCLQENEIAVGFLNYFRNMGPVNLTMEFFKICNGAPNPDRCAVIWYRFGRYISFESLIQNDDLQPLVNFEKEICDIFFDINCSFLEFGNFASVFPYQLSLTDFVSEFFSNIDPLLPNDQIFWKSSLEKFLEKHSAGMRSYACPSSL